MSTPSRTAGITRRVSLILPPLHPKQREFVEDEHRIVVAACGSKAGKTHGLAEWIILQAWNREQSVCWWCAPTLKQARIAFHVIGNWLPPDRVRVHRSDANMSYELLKSDGRVWSRIEFRSADNPVSLRGEGVHAAVVDEAGYWDYESYVSVMTTLTRTRGKLRVISTPKGKNWFFEQWERGWPGNPRSVDNPEYKSYRLPTHDNPFIPRESLAEFEKNMPRDVYRQEILAEFLDDSAGVFHNILGAQRSVLLSAPQPGNKYVMGIDWAKHEDYTVFCVADAQSRHVVYLEKHQDVDWNTNINRAIQCARKWNNAMVLMDSTGVGDVPFDMMRASYPLVEGYTIGTNAYKTALIQKLQFSLEQNRISTPKPDQQKTPQNIKLAKEMQQELEYYSYTISASQKMIFSAPDGFHDDMVIALAMANWKLDEPELVYRARNMRGF